MKLTKSRLKEIIREELLKEYRGLDKKNKVNERSSSSMRIGVEFKVDDFISAMKVFQNEKPAVFNKLLKKLGVSKSNWEKIKS